MIEKFIASFFSWIDFFIYLYIHTSAAINAVIFVATKSQRPVTNSTENLVLHRLRNNHRSPIIGEKRKQRYLSPILSRTTSGSNSPLKKIPTEILVTIFKCLDQHDLYHCSIVSNQWNSISTPLLWESFVPNTKTICNILVEPDWLSRCGPAVKFLDLSKVPMDVNDYIVQRIFYFCNHITSIDLSGCRLITDKSLWFLSQILSANQNNLQSIVLKNCRKITDEGLSYLEKACHKLEAIHLGGCRKVSDRGIIGLVTSSGSSIRRLRLSDCSRMTESSIHEIARLCGSRLEWLDIARTKAIKNLNWEYLVSHCPNISRLDISMKKYKSLDNPHSISQRQQPFHVNDEGEEDTGYEINETDELVASVDLNPLNELIYLLDRFNIQPSLTDASSRHRQNLIDQQRIPENMTIATIELVTINLTKLEHLNLSHWTYITDKAVKMLTMPGHRLTSLNLTGCSRMTDRASRYLTNFCKQKPARITTSDVVMISKLYANECDSWAGSSPSSFSSSSSNSSNQQCIKDSYKGYASL